MSAVSVAKPEQPLSPVSKRDGAPVEPALAWGEPRVLIIDDTRAIHEDFRKILAAAPRPAFEDLESALFEEPAVSGPRVQFQLDSAYQGEEGLALVQRSLQAGARYALAFVDMRMPPGWDGIETIARLWAEDPDLQVVVCTAYSDYPWDEVMRRLGQTDNLLLLKKPFDPAEVVQAAHAMTRKWFLLQQAKGRIEDLARTVARRTQDLHTANEQLRQEIAERKQLEQQLRQSQKMEAIGQLAGGVAHDFNNLLAIIRGNTELVLMKEDQLPEFSGECLKQVVAAADRAAGLTRQLLAFSRKQVMQAQPLQLNDVIGNFTKMLKRIIGEDIQLQCNYAARLPLVRADAAMLEQVLVNLVVNARDAMPKGGRLFVATEQVTFEPQDLKEHSEARLGEFVCLSVIDTGTGIAPEHLARIFEPFFTTKEVGKGTGLGLATVYGIAKQHGGWIEVASTLGAGSTFKLFLPAMAAATPEPAPPPLEPNPAGGQESILLVEDDEAVRSLTCRLLESFGYHVHQAASGPQALDVWRAHAEQLHLLITDMVMPEGVNGRELAERLVAERPQLKTIFMSGYSPTAASQDTQFLHRTGSVFLQKPCHWRELLQTIRRLLDAR